jgi:hypothetical protein
MIPFWSSSARTCGSPRRSYRPVVEALEARLVLSSDFVGVAGYYTPSDGYQHALLATTDGTVREVFFGNPQDGNGVHKDTLAHFSGGILGLAGYYNPSDGYQHALVATGDGTVHEVFFGNPQDGYVIHQDTLARFSGRIVGLAGYTTPSDGYQHALVATTDGTIHEVFFGNPKDGYVIHQDTFAKFSGGIAGLAGYYTASDGYQHALVATAEGTVHEVFFGNPQDSYGIHQDTLTHFSGGILGLAGFYTPSDGYQHAIVALADGSLHEVYFGNPQDGKQINQDTLYQVGGITALAGYTTSNDGAQHVLVTPQDGSVQQVHWLGGMGVHEDMLLPPPPTPVPQPPTVSPGPQPQPVPLPGTGSALPPRHNRRHRPARHHHGRRHSSRTAGLLQVITAGFGGVATGKS